MAPVSKPVALAAYLKAKEEKVPWENVLPPNIFHFLKQFAGKISSRMEIVFALLILMTSVTLGPKATFRSAAGFSSIPVVYLIAIALPTCGKTPAFQNIVANVSSFLVSKNIVPDIFVNSFTGAGLINSIKNNSGHCALCVDEVCHEMLPNMSTKKDDNLEFRRNMNTMWTGAGFTKVYRTLPKVNFEKTYMVIGGTAQPQPFLRMFQRVCDLQDGLEDRILALTAPCKQVAPPADNDMVFLEDDWICSLFSEIARLHKEERCYNFDPEATRMLTELRKAQAQAFQEEIDALDASLNDGAADTSDFGMMSGESKDVDMIERFSVILHVFTTVLSHFLLGANRTVRGVSPSVGQDSVRRSAALMATIRKQMDHYRLSLQSLETESNEQASASRRAINDRPANIMGIILTIPGKVVSSRMVSRFKRPPKGPRAADIIAAMKEHTGAFGEPGFVGVYKGCPGNRHLFYKSHPDDCDVSALTDHGVTEAEYRESYAADVTDPPVSIFTGPTARRDWTELYQSWLSDEPEGLRPAAITEDNNDSDQEL